MLGKYFWPVWTISDHLREWWSSLDHLRPSWTSLNRLGSEIKEICPSTFLVSELVFWRIFGNVLTPLNVGSSWKLGLYSAIRRNSISWNNHLHLGVFPECRLEILCFIKVSRKRNLHFSSWFVNIFWKEVSQLYWEKSKWLHITVDTAL